MCAECIDSTFPRGRGPCPLCRTPIGLNTKDFAKPVSLEFIPTKVAQTELFVDGLSHMNQESKLVSVLRAPAKLQKAVDGLEVDEDLGVKGIHLIMTRAFLMHSKEIPSPSCD